MRAGQLRHRVTIKQNSGSSANSYGEITASWATVASVPAEVVTLGGDERRYRHQVEAGMSHVVTIRHRSDVTAQMRVVWGSRTLEIESVVEADNRQRELVLMCKEVA